MRLEPIEFLLKTSCVGFRVDGMSSPGVACVDIVHGQIAVAPSLLVLEVVSRLVGAESVALLSNTRHEKHRQQRISHR